MLAHNPISCRQRQPDLRLPAAWTLNQYSAPMKASHRKEVLDELVEEAAGLDELLDARTSAAKLVERTAGLVNELDLSANHAPSEGLLDESRKAAEAAGSRPANLASTLETEPKGALGRATTAFERHFGRSEALAK